MHAPGRTSLAQGLIALAALLLLHQGGTSLVYLWRLLPQGASLAPESAWPVCAAPVAVAGRDGVRLGCADEPALRPCAAQAKDLVALEHHRCTVRAAAMPIAWYTTLGLRLNINRAAVEDLQALAGVGPSAAHAIVTYRQKHGPFRALGALEAVPGLGPVKVAALTHLVAVDDGG